MKVVLGDADWHVFTSCKAARGTRHCIVSALVQGVLRPGQSQIHSQIAIAESRHINVVVGTSSSAMSLNKPGGQSRLDQRVSTS